MNPTTEVRQMFFLMLKVLFIVFSFKCADFYTVFWFSLNFRLIFVRFMFFFEAKHISKTLKLL